MSTRNIPRCHCGRPAASSPGLFLSLFRKEQAAKQKQAARARKCLGCYEIDSYISALKKTRPQWAGE